MGLHRAHRDRMISIHAPLAGSDKDNTNDGQRTIHFNPRSPCGERQVCANHSTCSAEFQSTLPLRGATTSTPTTARTSRFQSTLPLRGATSGRSPVRRGFDFNPRSPCGERPVTPSRKIPLISYFNPRSPCGERHFVLRLNTKNRIISIHAPLAGSDNRSCP